MKRLIIISLAVTITLCSCGHKEHHNQEATTFMVTQPVKTDTVLHQTYVCQIRSIQHIELRALEKGYLQHIYVDEGKSVKKGQLLFQILPIVYEAEVQKAHAEVTFTEIEYQNTKALADSNIVSKNELALAKAKLEKAQADYQLAKANLGFTEIRAPFDGIVGRFNNVRMGSLLDEGELLTTLSDNNKMWVYFNVPEAEYINYITEKNSQDRSHVRLQMANHEMFDQDGLIETIESDFNNETGNIAFRATFNNPDHLLRHGQTGNIFMYTRVKNALLIPQSATYEILDKKFVFVVNKENIVEAREIAIQNEMPHIYNVSSGIDPSEKVLIEGIRKVKNGDKINVHEKPFYAILHDMQHLKAE